MNRITRKHLEQACRVLNARAGFKDEPLWQHIVKASPGYAGGRNVATVGMFYIDGAYGGWSLFQMVNEGGGVRDVFRCGHVPARDLCARINAYLQAQEDAERSA